MIFFEYFVSRWFLWQILLRLTVGLHFVVRDVDLESQRKLVKLTDDDKEEILRLHNAYRSEAEPPAANMRLMTWDSEAEKSAQLWAENCVFDHGMPTGYERTPMGQNVFIGRNFTVGKANFFWWTECKNSARCGGYTQMLWATSDRLGCGIYACPNWNLFVCHYRPPGNYIGEKPYEAGDPCSQCNTDSGGRCYQNLCVTNEECESLEVPCSCSLQCRNCGVLDKKNCRCECKGGWDTLDCSKRCENSHPWCLQNPGFPSNESCDQDDRIKDSYCRAMCDQCNATPDGNPKFVFDPNVPGGVTCPNGFLFDKDICECAVPKLVVRGSGSRIDQKVYLVLFLIVLIRI